MLLRSCMKQSVLPCLRDVAMRARTQTIWPLSAGSSAGTSVHARAGAACDWMNRLPKSCPSQSSSVTDGPITSAPFCSCEAARCACRAAFSAAFTAFASFSALALASAAAATSPAPASAFASAFASCRAASALAMASASLGSLGAASFSSPSFSELRAPICAFAFCSSSSSRCDGSTAAMLAVSAFACSAKAEVRSSTAAVS
mmetsp:Transcript_67393/g.162904  ORF Transcript_67393/g.162904 Transcript_67393/m.162904 type:complete len:202 (-) Transcript_67393:351-956(-)